MLDKAEAALSPTRQLAMRERLHALVEKRSRFVIATHSPIVMAYPNAWIYQVSAQRMQQVALEETEHYAVAGRF